MSMMNRRKIIEILFKLLLNDENINIEILETLKGTEEALLYDDERGFKRETELLCYLFKNYPYYEVINVLDNLKEQILDITAEKDVVPFALLLGGYIEVLKDSLKRKINDEVVVHLTQLAKIYYLNGTINSEIGIANIKQNMLNPEELFGTDVINNNKYIQQELFISNKEDDDDELKEKISKTSFNRRYRINNNCVKLFYNYFDDKTFTDFQNNIRNCIDKFCENPEEKILLLMTYTDVLDIIYQKLVFKWAEPQRNQYPLLMALKN